MHDLANSLKEAGCLADTDWAQRLDNQIRIAPCAVCRVITPNSAAVVRCAATTPSGEVKDRVTPLCRGSWSFSHDLRLDPRTDPRDAVGRRSVARLAEPLGLRAAGGNRGSDCRTERPRIRGGAIEGRVGRAVGEKSSQPLQHVGRRRVAGRRETRLAEDTCQPDWEFGRIVTANRAKGRPIWAEWAE